MGMVRNYKPISMSHMGHMSHEDVDGGMVEFPKRWHPMALSKTPWQGTQFQIVNIMGQNGTKSTHQPRRNRWEKPPSVHPCSLHYLMLLLRHLKISDTSGVHSNRLPNPKGTPKQPTASEPPNDG